MIEKKIRTYRNVSHINEKLCFYMYILTEPPIMKKIKGEKTL